MNNKEYEQLKEKALKQFKSSQTLLGKNGAFSLNAMTYATFRV